MHELVKLEYQGFQYSFNENGWFNATEAAAHFGKRVVDWFENKETKDYIEAMLSVINAQTAILQKVPKERCLEVLETKDLIKAKKGKSGGTWLHPKLAVAFARWLDARFAVWCDLQIDELIHACSQRLPYGCMSGFTAQTRHAGSHINSTRRSTRSQTPCSAGCSRSRDGLVPSA